MIYSKKYNCLFIHIPKTAGTSIYKVFHENNIHDRSDDYHITIATFKAKLGLKEKQWKSCFKFAFVRNPWDRMVSLYEWSLRKTARHQMEYRFASKCDNFIDWIKRGIGSNRKIINNADPLFRNSKRHLEHKSLPYIMCMGKIDVDFIGRFENLRNDWHHISNIVGWNFELGHEKKTKYKPYKEYYDEAAFEIVKNHFQDEIDFFGYEF